MEAVTASSSVYRQSCQGEEENEEQVYKEALTLKIRIYTT